MDQEELVATVRHLKDRQEIHDVLVRYCRAVDRLDRELLLSCYHDDAIDDHAIFVGSREEFADWAFGLHERYQRVTQHVITNHSCEIDGNVAHTETYYMFAGMNTVAPPLTVCGGRYVDRFERRDGHWAIAQRMSLLEWEGVPGEIFVQREATGPAEHGHHSTRDRTDPSYRRPLQVETAPTYRIIPPA